MELQLNDPYALHCVYRYFTCTFCVNKVFNPLNAELNPICHLLALLGAHHIFNVSELRVKHASNFYVCLSVHRCISVEKKTN